MTGATTAAPGQRRGLVQGALLVMLAGLVLSLGVVTIRGASSSDAWQYLFWRAIGLTLAAAALARFRDRRSPLLGVLRMSKAGWSTALFMTVSQVTFISAIKLTTVAETFILCALAPLLAAIAAWPLYGERITAPVLMAIALALAGVVVMSGGAVAATWSTGRLLAVLSAIAFAGYTLSVRRAAGEDLSASLVAVGALTAATSAVALLLAGLPLVPASGDVALALAHGALILSLGLYLFARGATVLSGVTVTLLAQTETVLAPLWGMLLFAEPLSLAQALGGLMVIAAVVLQTVASVGRFGRGRS